MVSVFSVSLSLYFWHFYYLSPVSRLAFLLRYSNIWILNVQNRTVDCSPPFTCTFLFFSVKTGTPVYLVARVRNQGVIVLLSQYPSSQHACRFCSQIQLIWIFRSIPAHVAVLSVLDSHGSFSSGFPISSFTIFLPVCFYPAALMIFLCNNSTYFNPPASCSPKEHPDVWVWFAAPREVTCSLSATLHVPCCGHTSRFCCWLLLLLFWGFRLIHPPWCVPPRAASLSSGFSVTPSVCISCPLVSFSKRKNPPYCILCSPPKLMQWLCVYFL